MRPHDIAILLKIACKGRQNWLMKDLLECQKIGGGLANTLANLCGKGKENGHQGISPHSLLSLYNFRCAPASLLTFDQGSP